MPVGRGKNFVHDSALQGETRGLTATRSCCFVGPEELSIIIMYDEAVGNSYCFPQSVGVLFSFHNPIICHLYTRERR